MTDYIATVPFRGYATMLVKNCKSKAEAKRKLADIHLSPNDDDIDGITSSVSTMFYKSAEFVEDGHD